MAEKLIVKMGAAPPSDGHSLDGLASFFERQVYEHEDKESDETKKISAQIIPFSPRR
jgi:hypothetical protein